MPRAKVLAQALVSKPEPIEWDEEAEEAAAAAAAKKSEDSLGSSVAH